MKTIHIILTLLTGLILSIGCEKEEALTPSESKIEPRFEFPQGNHPWDQTALKIYEKFGIYLIYKDLTNNDFNHSWTGVAGSSYAGAGLTDKQAEFTINFLDRHVFAYLPDKILPKILPPYWYLAYDFHSTFEMIPGMGFKVSCRYYDEGLDFWVSCMFYGDPCPLTGDFIKTPETPAEYKYFRGEILQQILAASHAKGNIVPPPGFDDGIDYQTPLSRTENAYKEDPDFYIVRGFPGESMSTAGFSMSPLSNIKQTNPSKNFVAYLQNCILYTEEEFETLWPSSKTCYRLIHQKRRLVLDYMKKEYGVDLNEIAQGPETL